MEKDYEDVKYEPTNRQKVLAPRLGRQWCASCDSRLVGFGSKCPICKNKDCHKNLKK